MLSGGNQGGAAVPDPCSASHADPSRSRSAAGLLRFPSTAWAGPWSRPTLVGEEQDVTAGCGEVPSRGRLTRHAPRSWPLALLLLCAFVGHDLMMAGSVSARSDGGATARLVAGHHAIHGTTGEPAAPAHHPRGSAKNRPVPHHVAGCGEGRRAVAPVDDEQRPATGASSIPTTAGDLPVQPGCGRAVPVPISPAAVRRALLQVFLI